MIPEALRLASSSTSSRGTELPDRTMRRSGDKIQMTYLLHLPIDILRNIFDHFKDPRITPQGTVPYRELVGDENTTSRQTLQKARLVCHLFNEIASPLLYPVLRIRLDKASLDVVDRISKNPLFAIGVRGIQVVLDYRPGELAADLSRFKDLRKQDLKEIYDACVYTRSISSYYIDDDTISPKPYKEYIAAMNYYSSVWSAWDGCCSQTNEDARDPDSLSHQRFLRQCHEQYQQQHKQQLQLITDGSFVNSLALSISRMPRWNSLHFVDGVDRPLHPFFQPHRKEPTLLLNNIEAFAPFMTAPLNWRTIETLPGGAELVPAKILYELPIAIHRSGAKLTDLHISCLPVLTNYSRLYPEHHDHLNPVMSNFQTACQHLKRFELGWGSMDHGTNRPTSVQAQDRASINKYLGTILSSRSLEDVRLKLSVYATDKDQVNDSGGYRLSPVLGAINWPCIKQVSILDVSLGHHGLEKFFNGLGHSLQEISLSGVRLRSGSWATALDILRNKVLSRDSATRCKVRFSRLTGGEFGKARKRNMFERSLAAIQFALDYEEPLLIVLSQKYVTGAVAENPLNSISEKV